MKMLSISLAMTTTLLAVGVTVASASAAEYSAYDPRRQESLWNTAIELQAQGRHEEAIPVLKQATHLSRINEGLNAASQLPYVRAEIQSYRALDKLALADERHAYLSRIEKQVLPSGPEKIDALLRQAEWHQYALLEDIDDDEAIQARMGKTWNFYRRALNESVATYGENSADLLPALHGMVRAQYLLAGHQGVGAAMPGNMRRERISASKSKGTFKRGISLLIAMQQLNRDRLKASREVQADDLIRMGDWAWWTGNRAFALEFYGDAVKLANGEVLKRGPEADTGLTSEEDVESALTTADPSDDPLAESAIAFSDEAGASLVSSSTEDSPGNASTLDSASDETFDETSGETKSGQTVLASVDSEGGGANASGSTFNGATKPLAEAALTTEEDEGTTEKFPTFRILEAPVPLPAIEGFDPVLKVKTTPATDADLIVTFTINANGKIANLDKVQVPVTTGPRSPDRVLRRLRRLRFRPVFEAGEPVESAPMTWVFGPEHWASPYDSTTEVST